MNLVFALVLLLTASYAVRAEPYQIFVVAGQSNAYGFQGDAAHYPLDVNHADAKIPFFWQTPGEPGSDGRWQTLRAQPGRFPAGHFGPEITFARKLFAAGFHPAIFKFSLSATSLAKDWRAPGGQGLYDAMVTALTSAVEQLSKQGNEVKIGGLVWVQGETDADNPLTAAAYRDNLRLLLRHFREQVAQNRNLPVVLSVDDLYPAAKTNPGVVEGQKDLAATEPPTVFSTMVGLEKADITHLTPRGIEYQGQRLSADFSALVAGKKHTH